VGVENFKKLIEEARTGKELKKILERAFFHKNIGKQKDMIDIKEIKREIFDCLNEITKKKKEDTPDTVLQTLFIMSTEVIDNMISMFEKRGVDINKFNKYKPRKQVHVQLDTEQKAKIVSKIIGSAGYKGFIKDYDPARGSYKNFLYTKIQGCIMNIFKKDNIKKEPPEYENSDGDTFNNIDVGDPVLYPEYREQQSPLYNLLISEKEKEVNRGTFLLERVYQVDKIMRKKCREILNLSIVKGKTSDQIKEILDLDISASGVRLRKRRCLKEIRNILKRKWNFNGI